MTIAEIKSRKEILDAIAEFDRLGRDRFLEKYGFDPSRSYWLVHEGKHYDSKAIIGAARGYARPDLGPMTADEFSGGEATVRRKLEELDFAVELIARDNINARKPAQSSGAFLLTWKESGWPYSNILRMLKVFESQGYVEEPWRIRANCFDLLLLTCSPTCQIMCRMSVIGTSRTNRRHQVLSPIGPTTDKRLHWGWISRQRLTHKRHWLCAAAMVLMPVSAPIKVLA
jgi:hypothetical protein